VVDNCSFDIEIGEDGLIKQKQVDLERLDAILNEGRMMMKVQFYVQKRIKHGPMSQKDFLQGIELFETEKNVFTRHNEAKMMKVLM
jgi:hypothetical protein